MSIEAELPSPTPTPVRDGTTQNRTYGFPKSVRLLESADFQRVTTAGRKLGGRFFLLFTLETTLPNTRLGLTVSRKVGNSVTRSRIKRLMREFYRLGRPNWVVGRDWVLIARPQAGGAAADLLRRDLQKLFSSFARLP
ncbi:MAG: ribonuclease P protein component [Magnetococcales bacterium]|nr:ribonuclease P protein component [Magnetococcales bacterium]